MLGTVQGAWRIGKISQLLKILDANLRLKFEMGVV